MTDRVRPYLFYGVTTALCATCLRTVEAKEVIEDGCVFLLKRCPEHGPERVLLADDADYWRSARERYLKPPEQVLKPNTAFRFGCPYDCGICTEHEQHGCVVLLEITDHCNLRCPTCYASSGPERLQHRDLGAIERMLDCIVRNEGEPDVVQLSGGEPTLHPQFFDVLAACRRRPIHHLMLNTNGVRIAQEDGFAERLAGQFPGGRGFEVYLQFDSLRERPLRELRGADLRRVREQALAKLNALDLSTTLVVTVRRGLNDDELGELVRFAVAQRCVRGITFQPVQEAGRCDGHDAARHRLTLSEVRRRLLEQCDWFAPADIVPVPCHPDCLAMAYALRQPNGRAPITPLTGLVPPEVLLAGTRNTITLEHDAQLQREFVRTFSTAHGPEGAAAAVARLLCCLPGVAVGDRPLRCGDVFRIVIMKFLDRHDLDLRSVRKSCVHIAHPDGRRIIPADLLHLSAPPPPSLHAPDAAPLGGRTVLGGLLGGWLAVELGKRRLGVRVPTGDGFALPLALALGCGRLGCAAAGCCAGVVCAPHWWAWCDADGVPRLPVQLAEAAFHFAAAAVLAIAARRGRARSRRLAAYLAVYAVVRLLLEFARENPRVLLGLSWHQLLALALLCVAGGTWWRRAVAARP